MIIEICLTIIALAFVLLTIYLIITLVSVRKTLNKTNRVLSNLDLLLIAVNPETAKLLSNSNELLSDIVDKSEKLDPLFDSVSNLGKALEKNTRSCCATSLCEEEREDEYGCRHRSEDWLELATAGLMLWQKIKRRREK